MGELTGAGRGQEVPKQRCLGTFLVVLVVSQLVFSVAGEVGQGIGSRMLLRDGMLAVLGLGAVLFAAKGAVVRGSFPERGGCAVNQRHLRRRVLAALAALMVVGAATGWLAWRGFVPYLTDAVGPSIQWGTAGATVEGVAALVAMCLFTGVFEEALFRVLLIGALEESGPSFARGPWFAAAVSALLFALLHMEPGLLALRFVQVAAFGFLMAELFLITRSFWVVVLAHGLFDVLLFAPTFVSQGVLPLLSFDAPEMAAIVGGSAAALALLAVILAPAVRRTSGNQQTR